MCKDLRLYLVESEALTGCLGRAPSQAPAGGVPALSIRGSGKRFHPLTLILNLKHTFFTLVIHSKAISLMR